MSKELDTFDKWWMMQSKIPYRDKKEIAQSAWNQSRTATLEWIPVSERLPDDTGEVLVWDSVVGVRVVFYHKAGVFHPTRYSQEFCRDLTHWMPLPNPPIDNLRGGK